MPGSHPLVLATGIKDGPDTAVLQEFSLEKIDGQTNNDNDGDGGENGGGTSNLLRAYYVPSTVLSTCHSLTPNLRNSPMR